MISSSAVNCSMRCVARWQMLCDTQAADLQTHGGSFDSEHKTLWKRTSVRLC